jgi:hypothetical protein
MVLACGTQKNIFFNSAITIDNISLLVYITMDKELFGG